MTINTTATIVIAEGNGVTSSFNYGFLIPAVNDVDVFYTDVHGVITQLAPTQYSISGIGNHAGGTVIYPLSGSPIPNGATITIVRNLPLLQLTTISNQGAFYPQVVESALDYQMMAIQQVNARSIDPLPISTFYTISNIAALRLNTTLFPAILVLGYATAEDGGEGIFIINALDTTSADNGGTIIVDANGYRWYRAGARSGAPYSVEWFGAKGDGATDDTVAIQKCLTAAGVDGITRLANKTYFVSATLTLPRNGWLDGAGSESSQLFRIGDYGNTVVSGTGVFPNNAGSAKVSNIWFRHGTMYTPGDTTVNFKATSGAHVRLNYGQGAVVEDCLFWRLPYSVYLNHCAITDVKNNWLQGVYDPANVGTQEGIANILLEACTIIEISGNYFPGNVSTVRSVTWVATDNTLVVSSVVNVGSIYGILIQSCEDLVIEANYIGRNSSVGIYYNLNAGASLDHRIIGNFFDGATVSDIYFATSGAAFSVPNVTISANVFNGELLCKSAIVCFNAIVPTNGCLQNFSITGNTFEAYVGTPLQLLSAIGGTISDNTMTFYNALGVSVLDNSYVTAGYIDTGSKFIIIQGNAAGGQGISDGFCHKGFIIGSVTGVIQLNNLNTGTGSFATQAGTTTPAIGWAVPTGTLSRGTFDESTVTLPQLARRVAALITDLESHIILAP